MIPPLSLHRSPSPLLQAYEKGVSLFRWPNVYDIWNRYLTKFIERYGGDKMERCRDMFEQCLEGCPPKFAKGQYKCLEGCPPKFAKGQYKCLEGCPPKFAKGQYKCLEECPPKFAKCQYNICLEDLPPKFLKSEDTDL